MYNPIPKGKMNELYNDDRVVVNELQCFKNTYLIIFHNEQFCGKVFTSRWECEKAVKPLIQIWNKVEVFEVRTICQHHWFSDYDEVKRHNLIYKWEKPHNRNYELNDDIWSLIKEYAGIYNIGLNWSGAKPHLAYWKCDLLYQLFQTRCYLRNKKNRTQSVKLIYRLMKAQQREYPNVAIPLDKTFYSYMYEALAVRRGCEEDYNAYLKPGDIVLAFKYTGFSNLSQVMCPHHEEWFRDWDCVKLYEVKKVNAKSFIGTNYVYTQKQCPFDYGNNIIKVVEVRNSLYIYYYADRLGGVLKETSCKNVMAFKYDKETNSFGLPILNKMLEQKRPHNTGRYRGGYYLKPQWERDFPELKYDIVGEEQKLFYTEIPIFVVADRYADFRNRYPERCMRRDT